jgi:hypothetical protein
MTFEQLPPRRALSPGRIASWRSGLVAEARRSKPARRTRTSRPILLAAATASVLAAATPTIGAGRLIQGLFQGPKGPATGQAQMLVSTQVTPGKAVTVWRAPTHEGGRCVFLAFADAAAANTRPSSANGGALCADTADAAAATDAAAPELGVLFSWSRESDGSVTTIAFGAARPSSHIVRVALRSAAGESDLPFEHGHYIVSLPGSETVGGLPTASGPLSIVGYDPRGNSVVTLDLNKLAATPTD